MEDMDKAIKRLIEIDNLERVRPQAKEEHKKLLEKVLVYYNGKTKQIITSPGANVILYLKQWEGGWDNLVESLTKKHKGNLKLLQDWISGIERLKSFERQYKLHLQYNMDREELGAVPWG